MIRCIGCQIGTAITNVIKNAYEAVVDKAEGKVLISIKPLDKDSLEILIEDNGRGVEPDILNRIFDPFFTTKPIGSGTGLGLSIAIAIIKSHFGDMYVESQLGLHTRVHIVLPVGKPH
ncbi:ATP-binding protein (plasmid) [Pseudoalteromonas xiamenensis]|uniref:sensor histidine kinase n=1 Tax=Pseudoalteromonas xiamenensis TaxID=882626 RepID=UPI0027E41D2E|nr:ATP-binding protein [Pseudoalteromonas xiamenensis]WMN62251.1 ATP-binding protein [Pseudoalteromonas xiamenensis]